MLSLFKKVLLIGILLIAVMSVGWYVLTEALPTRQASEQGLTELRVGVANAGGEFSSLVIVAHAQGYFADEGLDVILSKEESGVAAFKDLQQSSVDIITASDFAFVNNSFSDTSAKIIATVDAANAVEVVARRDSGIATTGDLVGKRVGVVPQTAADFVLVRFLTMNNLSLDDLSIVNITYGSAEEAIISGEVDAIIINNPYAYDISKALGPNAISWPAQYGQRLLFNAISNDELIDSNPLAVEGFLQALISAEKFIQLNPDQAKRDVMDSFSFTQEYIDELWENHVFRVSLDQILLPKLEAQARWIISYRANGSTAIPNYLERIYVNGLSSVAPGAVTIIR